MYKREDVSLVQSPLFPIPIIVNVMLASFCFLNSFRMFSNEDVTIGAWMLAMNVNHENNHNLCATECTPTSIAVWDIPKCSGLYFSLHKMLIICYLGVYIPIWFWILSLVPITTMHTWLIKLYEVLSQKIAHPTCAMMWQKLPLPFPLPRSFLFLPCLANPPPKFPIPSLFPGHLSLVPCPHHLQL